MPYRKNVYILGAGASAVAGAPLMWDFLSVARDLALNPRSHLAQDDRDRFKRVLAYRYELERAKASVDVDLDNIEDLFGLVDLRDAGQRAAREGKPGIPVGGKAEEDC